MEDTVTIIDHDKKTEKEDSLLSWARSPDRLLHQDTCLALASSFVLLRLLHFLLPKINACMKQAWRTRLYELNRLFPSLSWGRQCELETWTGSLIRQHTYKKWCRQQTGSWGSHWLIHIGGSWLSSENILLPTLYTLKVRRSHQWMHCFPSMSNSFHVNYVWSYCNHMWRSWKLLTQW